MQEKFLIQCDIQVDGRENTPDSNVYPGGSFLSDVQLMQIISNCNQEGSAIMLVFLYDVLTSCSDIHTGRRQITQFLSRLPRLSE